MIKVNFAMEEHLQNALLHLVDNHLVRPFEILTYSMGYAESFEIRSWNGSWDTDVLEQGAAVKSHYAGNGGNGVEMNALIRLIQTVGAPRIKNMVRPCFVTDEQQARVQELEKGEDRCKLALAYLGQTKLDDDVVLRFSMEDLCTAYALYIDGIYLGRPMDSIDYALQLTDPVKA